VAEVNFPTPRGVPMVWRDTDRCRWGTTEPLLRSRRAHAARREPDCP
jgi:hypothetical protein